MQIIERSMADNNHDKFGLEVGPNKIRIETEGGASGRLSNQLADLLSPFTEGIGFLGDKVRLYRQQAAIDALEAAKKNSARARI